MARMLWDVSSEVDMGYNLKVCFRSSSELEIPPGCIITFTYPIPYMTATSFFPW